MLVEECGKMKGLILRILHKRQPEDKIVAVVEVGVLVVVVTSGFEGLYCALSLMDIDLKLLVVHD